MKLVSQLNSAGFFMNATFADESPLEPGVYLLPGGCIDQLPPDTPNGHVARWDFDVNAWEFSINVEEFLPEKPFVPREVTMRQARLALLGIGKLEDISVAIAGLPSPTKEAVTIEWEYSQTVVRSRPYVAMLGTVLGFTEEELDNLFIEAAKL